MRGRLASNVAASVLTAAALLGTAAISVPVIVHHLGTAGFGIWSLAVTGVLYVTVAEAGLAPAIQRFVAVERGGGNHDAIARLLMSSLLVYLGLGVVFVVAAQPLAHPLVELFDVPARLRDGAETMFRITGLSMFAALLAAGLGNGLQGLERFGWFAISSAIGAVVFLAAAVLTLAAGHGLEGLAWSAFAQQATMVVARAGVLRELLLRRPRLIDRARLREVLAFAFRLQASVLSLLVNSQTDRIIVGLVAPASTLGQVSIAGQVADGSRLVLGAALSPMSARLSGVHGERDRARLHDLFDRLNRLWTIIVVGVITIGAGAVAPTITAWLGSGYGPAGTFGAILFVGYGVSLLPGVTIGYLRAVGQPGYEARYGLVTIALNVVATVAFGFAFGAYGVVAATAVAYLVATAWFLRMVAAVTPSESRALPLDLRVAVLAVVAGVASLGWGFAVNAVLPVGLALVPLLAGLGAAFVGYLSLATGITPTPARLRALAN